VLPLLVNVVLAFTHTDDAPLNTPGFGRGLIVILADDTELPHEAEVTV
jgi:hypothetical protein